MASDDGQLSASEREEYRKIIFEKTDYMKQMLDHLTTYTLLASPSYELKLVKVDSEEFFEMLLSGYEPMCRAKQIELQVDCRVSGNVLVHPRQMMRLMDNLMSNAIRHTVPGGRILLAAVSSGEPMPQSIFSFAQKHMSRSDDKRVYLIVQNEGEGIEEQHLPHVCDPLYQSDETRSKKDEQGSGLGLSIAKQIVEKHGGALSIYSRQEIGVCVVCTMDRY